jgi:hypothetical protein
MIGPLQVFHLLDVSLCFFHSEIHAEMCRMKWNYVKTGMTKLSSQTPNYRY